MHRCFSFACARHRYLLLPAILAGLFVAIAAEAEEDYSRWPVLVNPFESTSGGGVMIDGYRPTVEAGRCRTDFTVTIPGPGGGRFANEVEFDAVPAQGGVLCTNGRWRAKDGSASGTTPFRVFLRDGVVRCPPE